MIRYRIEVAEEQIGPGCACCTGEGGVRGFLYDGEDPRAVYFAEPGGYGGKTVVLMGIVIGKWEGDTKQADRNCFCFALSFENGKLSRGPTIPYLLAYPEFVMLGVKIQPEEAQAHAGYSEAADICDAIVSGDHRFWHLRGEE
ncbi:MAG: hypothetical protein FJX29_10785, partial [Alphaproteobacteria bacterium]|nr:hypothetical protein [Alphaproteobacteria bacterium]